MTHVHVFKVNKVMLSSLPFSYHLHDKIPQTNVRLLLATVKDLTVSTDKKGFK